MEHGDHEQYGGDYADVDRIRGELVLARRLFARHKWPEIDVTKRSVEETAATIYQMIQVRQQPELKALAAELPNPGWTGESPEVTAQLERCRAYRRLGFQGATALAPGLALVAAGTRLAGLRRRASPATGGMSQGRTEVVRIEADLAAAQ